MSPIHFLVPGSLGRPTGGTQYDRRIIEGLRQRGETVQAHELAGDYPGPDFAAEQAATDCLSALPDDACVVVDGLALGGLPDVFGDHARRLRLVAMVHHPLTDETGLDLPRAAELRDLEQRALAVVGGVIASSAFTADRLENLGLYPGDIHVVTPGCTPSRLASGSPDPDTPPSLLCVGSLIPRKGQDVLISALGRLADLPWQCTLAGSTGADADWNRHLQQLIADVALAHRIHSPGALSPSALEDAYQQADLFILPSRYEGYGMVITEAVARGLPVVTTDGGALPSTLPPGAGLTVPVGDSAALAAAIRRVLTEDELRAALEAGARRARRSLQDWDEVALGFQRALRNITHHD
ncbi:glycosyltransferase [Spiribacter sp. 2438]|uniref:glycosyltransferase family 4 protein n=1 Tax=Spiribacter sp. 2438 TaxID=2666185 RepID=UPI0012AF9C81|nr:glycosyltransferase family 4 protein [Spiribacter sp. 2438]QGM22003.1 glycosyltransferase [Spiribacter sp. 2438]